MTEAQVLRIVRLAGEGLDPADIAARVGFGLRTVTAVLDHLRAALAGAPALETEKEAA